MFSFFYGIVSKQMFILVIRKQLRPLDLGKVIVSRYDDYGYHTISYRYLNYAECS
jgi:hypothetical protein